MVDFHDFGISQQLRTETQMMFSPAPLFCFFFADSPERRTDVWREGLPPSKTPCNMVYAVSRDLAWYQNPPIENIAFVKNTQPPKMQRCQLPVGFWHDM